MAANEEREKLKTGQKNVKPSHFTCDHCNSMIWVEEEENVPECPECGESRFGRQSED